MSAPLRPWRVRYEWLENGVQGCETRRTREDALRLSDELLRTAERRGLSVKVTVEHRDTGPEQVVTSVAPTAGGSR